MVGMGLGAGLVLPMDIKTEIFPAPVAEFKEVAVYGHATHFTVMDLHSRPLTTQRLITDGFRFNSSVLKREQSVNKNKKILVFFTPKALKGVRSSRAPNLNLSPCRVG